MGSHHCRRVWELGSRRTYYAAHREAAAAAMEAAFAAGQGAGSLMRNCSLHYITF
jgi:hypothetical protein